MRLSQSQSHHQAHQVDHHLTPSNNLGAAQEEVTVGHHLTPSNNMGAAQEEVTAVDHLTPSSNMEAT